MIKKQAWYKFADLEKSYDPWPKQLNMKRNIMLQSPYLIKNKNIT